MSPNPTIQTARAAVEAPAAGDHAAAGFVVFAAPPSGALSGFLAAFFAMLAVVYGAKLLAARHRDGRAPVFDGPNASAQRDRGVFRLFQALIVAVCVARPFTPAVEAMALEIPALRIAALNLAGAAMMLGGAAIAFYAHTYMGALWRSGVPDAAALDEAPDALLQRGPFARSRNPIFLGVIIAQIGFFLAWPSVFTAVCSGVGATMILRQVSREERGLEARFGPSYRAYRARTPRWL